MAGLLTCGSLRVWPFPARAPVDMPKRSALTVAGAVRDLHPVPKTRMRVTMHLLYSSAAALEQENSTDLWLRERAIEDERGMIAGFMR